ncbi:cysteine desulfurase-like protein [Vibrio sp. SM6]|uniref:Cysteine desulfurase-like protein n=1 Tax=Vibrio agarilyticus TaxID=2726741 RepID=A0A7X8YF12_9VIBR|nr:cysteine desulfurase-like protein [Vibrio agarilyticus]NLS11363.1 cysteine desulfurase-like protein [Vibrio agarilyticus]
MPFDLNALRAQFPALVSRKIPKHTLFFDGPSGSKVPQRVVNAMVDYLENFSANFGGHFYCSAQTHDIVSHARMAAATLLNAPHSDNIVFGANMTSLTFTLSRAIAQQWQPGDEVIVTQADHYANVSPWQQMAQERGATVHKAPLDLTTAGVDVAQILSLITPRTRLIAVTAAANVTGTITPLDEIISAAKAVGAQVYVDAVHCVPHRLLDVTALGCDYLVCSNYKFFGPHLGIAYIANPWLESLTPSRISPAPNHGPSRFEMGTQSFEALAGLSASIDYLAQWGESHVSLRKQLEQSFDCYATHEAKLTCHFLERLAALDGVTLYGIKDSNMARRTPTFALSFDSCNASELASALGQRQICTGSGHFYAPDVIDVIGLSQKGGVLRIGCMHYNTLEEISQLFDVLELLLRTR